MGVAPLRRWGHANAYADATPSATPQGRSYVVSVPIGRMVTPVIRTPINLVHFAGERTPVLNALSATWRSDVIAGGAARATALGKLGGGSTLAATLVYFAGSGIVTGGGPIDPTLRREKQELTGWQLYSIRLVIPTTATTG